MIGFGKMVVALFVGQRHQARQKIGRARALSALDEVLLLFVHLRHHLVDSFASVLFEVSHQTYANVRNAMEDWFYQVLSPRLSLGSAEERLANGVQTFHDTYMFLMDGCEQKVLGSDNPFTDTSFYSIKKGSPTINKVAVVHIRTGRFLWLSPSFPGAYNDQVIAEACQHLWHDKLHPLENGLGDSSFDGLRAKGMRVDGPPSSRNQY